MRYFDRFGIARRIYFVSFVLIAAMGAVALAAWLHLTEVEQLADRTGDNRVPQQRRIGELELDFASVSAQLRHALLVKSPADLAPTLADIADRRKHIETTLGDYEKVIFTQAGRDSLEKIKAQVAQFWSVAGANIRLIEAGKKDEAFAMLVEKTLPARNRLATILDDERKRQFDRLEAEVDQIESAATSTRTTLVLMVLAVAASLSAFAWYISGVLRRRVSFSREVVERVRDGDLTGAIGDDATDEFSPLLAALADMQKSLTRVVGDVRSGVETMAAASGQIADGNHDLSSRTEQQAGNLQQTASSLEQLTSTVNQNTESAKQANQFATSASEVAARGGVVVGQVVETMGEIQGASRKIAEIISVIDGIAFQTNILALNAAVEAARAGEQGRGFAVVASEVRSLAQRSAQAAREIKTLISDSVKKVENGSKLVNEAGTTMGEIVARVKRVTDLIAEITAASLEQSSGVTQVNQAVTQLDQATQQNAALVEQSAAAASSLREQAQRLAEAVAVFKLSRDEARLVIAKAQAATRTQPRRPAPSRIVRRKPDTGDKPPSRNADGWDEF